MSDVKMIFVDTETTGLSHVRDKIIEIGAIKVNLRGKIEGTFNELGNPGFPLPEQIKNITNITDDMLKDKQPSEKIVINFLEWCKNNDNFVFVAHSAKFDMRMIFMPLLFKGMNIPKHKVIDTLTMYRKRNYGTKDNKLETLSEFVGYKPNGLHRALCDAHVCMKIFSYFISREYRTKCEEDVKHVISSISHDLQEFLPDR